jgi:catechol 2,3-dioxygenase-like lactoylglutathione lyase family enzyme
MSELAERLSREGEVRGAAPPPIQSIHHVAFRCFDAEETRSFYEDVMGMELAAALVFDEAPGDGAALEYMHLFFRMGDENFIAFFDLPDHLASQKFKSTSGFNRHIALRVRDHAEVEAVGARWREHGLKVEGPIDHGFVYSVYTYDPNGIQVEVTCPTSTHDQVLAEEQLQSRAALAEWTEKTRSKKEASSSKPVAPKT